MSQISDNMFKFVNNEMSFDDKLVQYVLTCLKTLGYQIPLFDVNKKNNCVFDNCQKDQAFAFLYGKMFCCKDHSDYINKMFKDGRIYVSYHRKNTFRGKSVGNVLNYINRERIKLKLTDKIPEFKISYTFSFENIANRLNSSNVSNALNASMSTSLIVRSYDPSNLSNLIVSESESDSYSDTDSDSDSDSDTESDSDTPLNSRKRRRMNNDDIIVKCGDALKENKVLSSKLDKATEDNKALSSKLDKTSEDNKALSSKLVKAEAEIKQMMNDYELRITNSNRINYNLSIQLQKVNTEKQEIERLLQTANTEKQEIERLLEQEKQKNNDTQKQYQELSELQKQANRELEARNNNYQFQMASEGERKKNKDLTENYNNLRVQYDKQQERLNWRQFEQERLNRALEKLTAFINPNNMLSCPGCDYFETYINSVFPLLTAGKKSDEIKTILCQIQQLIEQRIKHTDDLIITYKQNGEKISQQNALTMELVEKTNQHSTRTQEIAQQIINDKRPPPLSTIPLSAILSISPALSSEQMALQSSP